MRPEQRKLFSIIIVLIIVTSFLSGGVWVLIRFQYPRIIKKLPDPFIFNNGTRVSTMEEWEIRRGEIKTLLQSIEYGTIPNRPDAILVSKIQSEILENGTKDTIILTITPSNSTPLIAFNITLWMYLPNKTGPHPVIIKVGRDPTETQIPIEKMSLDRDYAYVCYNHTDLDPDTKGYDVVGPAQSAYPAFSWGSLGVWAWGASRVVDYLIGENWVDAPDGFPNIDPSKLIITGHSRKGKTALLAGAMDERFAMVVPNGSGCGGSGSFLVQGSFSETIRLITLKKTYRSWFKEDFAEYRGKEKNLPFDQHFLTALIAPRILLSTNALQDYWANPSGTQTIYKATNIVYEFLGFIEKNGIHYREGKHEFNDEDVEVLLDFADLHFLGKEIKGDFYMTPYPYKSPIEFSAP